MTRAVSLATQITQIHGLLGTQDANAWETDFIESVWGWSAQGTTTLTITGKQAEVIERIWRRHFS